MLAEPLINEFGVLRAIVYMAQHPFQLEENNLRVSALRYQQRARDALAASAPRRPLNAGRLAVQATPSEQPTLETISD